jgi:hypothetical protein
MLVLVSGRPDPFGSLDDFFAPAVKHSGSRSLVYRCCPVLPRGFTSLAVKACASRFPSKFLIPLQKKFPAGLQIIIPYSRTMELQSNFHLYNPSLGEFMRTECTHFLASGRKCKAPAVGGTSLCRHHHPRDRARQHAPLILPEINDNRTLLRAINDVVRALAEGRIKRGEGGTLLALLQFVSTVMNDVNTSGWPLVRPIPPIHQGARSKPEAQKPIPPGPQAFRPAVCDDAAQVLATMQSASIDQALDDWLAKQGAPIR